MAATITCINKAHGVQSHVMGSAAGIACARSMMRVGTLSSNIVTHPPRGVITISGRSDRDELLHHLDTLVVDRPDIMAAGVKKNMCGPVAMATAEYLRSRGMQAGVVHVYGSPPIISGSQYAANPYAYESGAAHFIVSVPGAYIDLAHYQFDPSAPSIIITEEEDFLTGVEDWNPWDAEAKRIDWDQDLNPAFASYGDTDGGALMYR